MIYLCRNKRNGLVKIGFTVNPKYREKTLQSEEPDVFFERLYEGTIRDEEGIHSRFQHLRIRGEWFELGPSDVEKIDEMLRPAAKMVAISDRDNELLERVLEVRDDWRRYVNPISDEQALGALKSILLEGRSK